MKKYGRSGWFNDSYRHYLAGKGISSSVRKKNKKLRADWGFRNMREVEELYVD